MISEQKGKLRELITSYGFNCIHGIADSDDYEAIISFIEQEVEKPANQRAAMMREKAITCMELTKGFLPEQRDNCIKAIEELSGYILELTTENSITP